MEGYLTWNPSHAARGCWLSRTGPVASNPWEREATRSAQPGVLARHVAVSMSEGNAAGEHCVQLRRAMSHTHKEETAPVEVELFWMRMASDPGTGERSASVAEPGAMG